MSWFRGERSNLVLADGAVQVRGLVFLQHWHHFGRMSTRMYFVYRKKMGVRAASSTSEKILNWGLVHFLLSFPCVVLKNYWCTGLHYLKLSATPCFCLPWTPSELLWIADIFRLLMERATSAQLVQRNQSATISE